MVLDDELGCGMAKVESLCCSVDGHTFLHDKLDQSLLFLSSEGGTLLLMME